MLGMLGASAWLEVAVCAAFAVTCWLSLGEWAAVEERERLECARAAASKGQPPDALGAAREWYVSASEGMVVDRVLRLERLTVLALAGREYRSPARRKLDRMRAGLPGEKPDRLQNGSITSRPDAASVPDATFYCTDTRLLYRAVRGRWPAQAFGPAQIHVPDPRLDVVRLVGGPLDGLELPRAEFLRLGGVADVAVPGGSVGEARAADGATARLSGAGFPVLRAQTARYRLERSPDMAGWIAVPAGS